MVHSVSCFTSITAMNTFVNLPNGESALVTHIGTVEISSKLVLHNVLCVPSFTFNLLSVSKLAKSISCCLMFFGTLYFIQDLAHWSTIGLGKEYKGLYLLEESTSTSSNCSTDFHSVNNFHAVNNVHVQPHVWHYRLGHLSNAKSALLKHKDVPIFNENKMVDCEICPLAKQKRLPFTPNSHVSSHRFDLIHCDLWGPFSTPTIDGCKFFLTIVDDCSRCTWVYLLKHKSQTQAILEQFYLMVETQF